MPTNDERREVAARLRKVTLYDPECHVAKAVGLKCNDSGNECYNCNKQMFNRLADLIEPEERTCHMDTDGSGEGLHQWWCSECGGCTVAFTRPPFCSRCGAKVVG